MESANLAENLRRVRKSRGKSQQAVAEAAGISRIAYANIEKRGAVPRPQTLAKIAAALSVGMESLLRPVKQLEHVRFRSRKRMVVRDDVLAVVSSWLDDFNGLEELLAERRQVRLRDIRQGIGKKRAHGNRAASAASAVRGILGTNSKETIRDVCGVLEFLGVKVLPMAAFASEAFSGLSVSEEDGGPAIVVNAWKPFTVEHRIFTAAHELGHLLLHLDEYDVTKTMEDAEVEREANMFASHLLMPPEGFSSEWNDTAGLALYDRVMKVKRIFRVSYRTVLFRLCELRICQDSIWPRFQFEHQKRTGRTLCRADEPEPIALDPFASVSAEPDPLASSDFVEDRLSRLVRRAVEEDRITLGRAAHILQISLNDMRARSASWVA